MTLRRWQRDALEAFHRSGGDFLAVATPGAGKTIFAVAVATDLLAQGAIGRVLIVAPTTRLRHQWGQAASRIPDGYVTTYQELAAHPEAFAAYVSERPTLLVLDEVHHCQERQPWGEALQTVGATAVRRLLLSGTPWRSDGTSIPFIDYDAAGAARAQFRYLYQDALADGYVRPVNFLAMDGVIEDGDVDRLSLLPSRDVPAALSSALAGDSPWMYRVLRVAAAELDRIRLDAPDAGGLVVAMSQADAQAHAEALEEIVGEPVAVVMSDTPGAHATLDAFAHERSRWVVSVQMIAEGVDIPRLAVCVYATNRRTEKFFTQVVGRVVRKRPGPDSPHAVVIMPSLPTLIQYAKVMGIVRGVGLKDPTEGSATPGGPPGGVRWMDVGDAVEHSTISIGDAVTDRELRQAREAVDLLAIDIALPQVVLLARCMKYLDRRDIELRAEIGRAAAHLAEPPPRPDGLPSIVSARPRPGPPSLATPSAFRSSADRRLIADLLAAWPDEEPKVQAANLLTRLRESFPERYGAWDAEDSAALTKALKEHGVPTIQVNRTSSGGSNRNGYALSAVRLARRADGLVSDVLSIWPGDVPWLWSESIIARLVELDPEGYGHLQGEQGAAALGAHFRARGVEVKDRHRKVAGKGVTRKGVSRSDLEAHIQGKSA